MVSAVDSASDLVVDVTDGASPQGPVFRIGLVADVQYAEAPDASSFHGVPRFYRNSLLGLRRALDAFETERVAFALNLGDTVDGKQKEAPEKGFDDVMACFEGRPYRTFHMVGNHDLYNLPRPRLNERLSIPPAGPYGSSYYSFVPHPSNFLRVIVLDSYDLSLLDAARGPGHPLRRRADEIMAVNPNDNKHSPEGLVGLNKRFVEFGGGVSDGQLAWLASELAASRAARQKVLVAGHVPFCPGTCPEPCVLWNYEEVLALLEGSGNVVATLAGHAHMNGYVLRSGIHHIVMPSILETPPGRDAFATLDVYPTHILMRGRDTCASLVLRFAGPNGAPLAPPPPLAAVTPWTVEDKAAGGCGAEARQEAVAETQRQAAAVAAKA